jgi:UDP-glucose 4-epimerase
MGGAGFIGSHIARGFVRAGTPTTVLSRRPPSPDAASRLRGARVTVGDARDPDVVERALEDVTSVIWCIGGLLPADSNRLPAEDVVASLPPLLVVLGLLAARPGAGITLISSGGTVYGNPTTLPVPEAHHLQPISSHGVMKVAAEHYVALYDALHRVPGLVLRCGNVYGEGQLPDRTQGVVATALAHAVREEPLVVFGDGSEIRDYIHVDDVVDVVLALAGSAGGVMPRVINVGTGIGSNLLELIEVIRSVTGLRLRVRHSDPRPGDVHAVVLDVTLLRSLIDFDPVSLYEGLERVWVGFSAERRVSR